ncbi:MAG: [protein-PII] uridylyltransferase, partial [Luminiphilus sp.]|nr:[protein-PII] uridylyltransferase [Luminiphilus sp.]
MSSANLTNEISDLRAQLKQRAEEINASFDPNLPVDSLLIDRSDAVDSVLQTLWMLCGLDRTDSSLVAVGGYGRGELFPHSDVDILVLQPNDSSTDDAKVSSFVSALWDLGLKIGHSVRSIDECIDVAKGDLTVVTTYLETRVLAGDPSLLDTLKTTIEQSNLWPSATFFAAKREEQETRHDKYGRTGYSLEPNVKSSPGGLRDLQVIGWITQRHFGCSINELPTGEFLTVEERGQLAAGKDFLSRVRAALHIMTGRDEDRLLFEHQRSLASLWGFEDEAKLGVEQFMQLYFRQVQSVVHLTDLLNTIFDQKLLHDCESPPLIIDDDFELIDERIAARWDNVFSDNPANLLRLFVIIANDERIAKIDPHTIRLLRQSAQLIDDDYRSNEVHRQLFREVLKGRFWMTKQLRRMLRHGILARYLPEFGQVVGQMQFDMFHTYTVDAHTMEVIAHTRRFLRADYTDKFPVTTRIAQRLRKPLLLFVAALYHDIGKGRGGDHSELGAVDARLFCEQHFFNEADTELIVWLVKNHLFMSSFSQRRDISDPAEIQ